MKYIDYACAWTMLLTAAIFLAVIEIWRPRGVGFDTPLFWIPVAMINFLRLRNGYRGFEGLRTFAIVANLLVLVLETIRLGEWGAWLIRNWGVYYALAAIWLWVPYIVIFIVAATELGFSILQKDAASSPSAPDPLRSSV
jgi:hypothetical protein